MDGEAAAWVQAWGTIIGLIVAIGVPAWLEWRRQEDAKAELSAKRAAAFRVMRTVVHELRFRPEVGRGEIEGVGSVLDRIDPLVLPERAAVILVSIRARVATAAAHSAQFFATTNASRTATTFDHIGAEMELEGVRSEMGVNLTS